MHIFNIKSALTALCSDSVRLFQQIESLDIIRLIRGILLRIDIVPKEYLGNCCNCIEYIARGLRTDYLKDNLPTLRIPLQSIPTKHPSLLGLTRQASWTVMKATLDQEKAAAARASKLGLPPPTANWEPGKSYAGYIHVFLFSCFYDIILKFIDLTFSILSFTVFKNSA